MRKTLIVPPSTSHSFFSNPTVSVVEACCWGSCSLVICHWIRGGKLTTKKTISSLSLDPRKPHVERLGSGVMKEKKYSAFKQAEYLSSSWLLVGDHLLRPRRHVQPDEVARKPHTDTHTQTQKKATRQTQSLPCARFGGCSLCSWSAAPNFLFGRADIFAASRQVWSHPAVPLPCAHKFKLFLLM